MLFESANAANIPPELTSIDAWLSWRYVAGRKVPCVLDNGTPRNVDAHDPTSWVSFQQAVAIAADNPDIGVGFDLQQEQGLVGLDFDHCVEFDGAIADSVQELLAMAGSYYELSPSGKGIRCVGYGTLAEGSRKISRIGTIGVERYCHRRFITITGVLPEGMQPKPLGSLDILTEVLDGSIFKRQPPKPRANISADPDFDAAAVRIFIDRLGKHRSDQEPEWFRVCSFLAAFGEAFFDEWMGFSRRSEKHRDAEAREKWDSVAARTSVDTQQAFGSLMAMAAEDSGVPQDDLLRAAEAAIGRPRATHQLIGVTYSKSDKPRNQPIDELELPEPGPMDCKPFPTHCLPGPLKLFVESTAVSLVVDPSPLALACLITCSAAVGASHRLRVNRTWKPFPMLWGAVIAASGDMKTPILQAAAGPLKRRQAKLKEEHDFAMLEYGEAVLQYREACAEAKAAKQEPPPLPADFPSKPTPPPRYLTSDATVESLGQLLERHHRGGLMLLVDELVAWFGGMDKYKRGSSDEGFFLSSYDGHSHSIDRKSGGKDGEGTHLIVPRCALTILGGIQPALVQLHLDETRRASGTAQRLLFSMPPRRAYRWCDEEIPAVALDGYDLIVNRLAEAGDDEEPTEVSLSDHAREAFKAWTKQHARHSRRYPPDLAAAASKMREIPARIGILLHLIEHVGGDNRPADELHEDTMQAAVEVAEWFRHETERVYRLLKMTPGDLAGFMEAERAGAAVTEELWDAEDDGRSSMSRSDIAEALAGDDLSTEAIVQALAALLHRGVVSREGEGVDERWHAAPRPEMPSPPVFSDLEAFGPREIEL